MMYTKRRKEGGEKEKKTEGIDAVTQIAELIGIKIYW